MELAEHGDATGGVVATCHGRAAHAAKVPNDGKSAILALAEFLLAASKIPENLPGVLVNVGNIRGGTAATKFRFSDKQRMGVAQGDHGRRRWRHAWANAGTGVACALGSMLCEQRGLPLHAEALRWAFVGTFAAALSDTLSSEFGQLAGKRPLLITTGEEVPVGTDGGITLAGTLMGILGAALLSLLGRSIGLTPVRATLPLLLAGLAGNLLDSWLGATLERRGVLNNEGVNFINTLGGAALGYAGFWLMSLIPVGLRDLGLQHLLDFFI
ncbi:MAG: DUF92 domain-containing protein [Verrucomicrobia bacterium]|nr:DUF92 domain-containing protein [Verrucomicrobiota bacterium]